MSILRIPKFKLPQLCQKCIFLPTLNAKMPSETCSIRLNNKIEKHDFQHDFHDFVALLD